MYLGESLEVTLEEHEIDLTYYDETISNVDAHVQQKAIEVELESILSNQDWELVEALEGIKPIGCKWVYKRKRRVYGKIETYKARLVVKGYSQKLGFDYDEAFSPIAMLKSIRILLPIATHLNYEI